MFFLFFFLLNSLKRFLKLVFDIELDPEDSHDRLFTFDTESAVSVFLSPRLIDMGKVYHQSNLENLEQAFDVAERDLGVTRLLDPEGKTSLSHLDFSRCSNSAQ